MYIGLTHWWEPPPLAVGTLSKKISATMTPEVFGGFHVRRLKSSKNTNHVIICNIFSVYKCGMRSDSSILIPFHHPFDMLTPLRFPTGCTDTSYPLWPMPFPPTKKKNNIFCLSFEGENLRFSDAESFSHDSVPTHGP